MEPPVRLPGVVLAGEVAAAAVGVVPAGEVAAVLHLLQRRHHHPALRAIKTDALKKDFPCAVSLIINNLGSCGLYSAITQPFVSTTKKPDLTLQDSNLAWNSYSTLGGNNSYMFGQTEVDPTSKVGLSMIITLNSNMLKNSSQLLIAAAAIHETMHAYINYSIINAMDGLKNGYKSGDSWLYGLDTWIDLNGLPPNYSSH
ncbi:MAG: hypothetical protein ACXVJD_10020, partial [Mucilaginibacter sp.]